MPFYSKILLRLSLIVISLLIPVSNCSNPEDQADLDSPELQGSNSHRMAGRSKITAIGRLEPAGDVIDLGVPVPGLIGELLVEEGDEVEAAQVLARMDSYSQRKAEYELVQVQLKEAQRRLAAEIKQASTQVQEAEIQIQQLETVIPLEIQSLEAELERLDAQMKEARQNLQRFQNLSERNSVTEKDLDSQILTVEVLEAQIKRTKFELDRLEKGKALELSLAKARLNSSRAQLERVENSSNLGTLERQLSLAETNLGRTLIRSPINGQILKIYSRPGELLANGLVLQMADTSQMYVVAEVYESDIRWVFPGSEATAFSRSLAGPLKGVVERIRPMVLKNQLLDLDPASDIDRRVIEVRIRLAESQEAKNFINLQVDVEIEMDNRSGD